MGDIALRNMKIWFFSKLKVLLLRLRILSKSRLTQDLSCLALSKKLLDFVRRVCKAKFKAIFWTTSQVTNLPG